MPQPPDVELLRCLRAVDGFVPASTLALAAGLPPAGLRERLNALEAAGYRFEERQVPEPGFRLLAPPESLIADDLMAALPRRCVIGREIIVFEETGSTNDVAARAGHEGSREGLVIFAESQRSGRGRLGRHWSSLPRRGLWFSVLLRPRIEVSRWPELTFCAALAVAESAEAETGQSPVIKWPNDVLIDGRKIAGILLECHHREAPGFVVIGIGVNVLHREEEFAPELRSQAGSLSIAAGRPVDRRVAAAAILSRLDAHYAAWPADFPGIMEVCRRRFGLVQPPAPAPDAAKAR